MGSAIGTVNIHCQECDHFWAQPGQGSIYEREVIESRPCPCCGSYTLCSPEPSAKRKSRRPGHLPVWSPVMRKSF